jgi:hypothetical protein
MQQLDMEKIAIQEFIQLFELTVSRWLLAVAPDVHIGKGPNQRPCTNAVW